MMQITAPLAATLSSIKFSDIARYSREIIAPDCVAIVPMYIYTIILSCTRTHAQDYIGGSRMLWIKQHVVGHHCHTNREGHDPDIKYVMTICVNLPPLCARVCVCVCLVCCSLTMMVVGFLRSNSVMNLSQHQSPTKSYMSVQNWYYMPLLHLLGFQWVFGGMYDLLTLTYKGEKLPNSYVYERNVSLAFRLFFYVRRLGMYRFMIPNLYSCVNLFHFYPCCMLALFFNIIICRD